MQFMYLDDYILIFDWDWNWWHGYALLIDVLVDGEICWYVSFDIQTGYVGSHLIITNWNGTIYSYLVIYRKQTI